MTDFSWLEAVDAAVKILDRKARFAPQPQPRHLLMNPEKTLRREIAREAHKQVNHAVKYGQLIKPKACEVCDQEKPLQGHHADYNYPLDVIWCCNQCHHLIHKNCEVIYVV